MSCRRKAKAGLTSRRDSGNAGDPGNAGDLGNAGDPGDPGNSGDAGEYGSDADFADIAECDVMWNDLPPQSTAYKRDRKKETYQINQQILHELIELGEVDCDRVVQIIQLMAISEFGPFFRALCCIDLKDPAKCADRLARCAHRLGPKLAATSRTRRTKLAAA